MSGEMIMDAEQTAKFEQARAAAGVRFVGGLYACTAKVEHEPTGAATYYGLTPRDTRRTSDNFTAQGWFTGLVPITVPIAATSFGAAAWAAQESFDSVRSWRGFLTTGCSNWRRGWTNPVRTSRCRTSCTAGRPLNAILAATELGYSNNIGIYSDGRFSYQLTIYVFLYDAGTAMSVLGPDNPIARKSIARYIAAMKSVCLQVAECRRLGTWCLGSRCLGPHAAASRGRRAMARRHHPGLGGDRRRAAAVISEPQRDGSEEPAGDAARERPVQCRRPGDDEGLFSETGTDDLLLVVLSDERGSRRSQER